MFREGRHTGRQVVSSYLSTVHSILERRNLSRTQTHTHTLSEQMNLRRLHEYDIVLYGYDVECT